MVSAKELDDAISSLTHKTAKERKFGVQCFSDLNDSRKVKLLTKHNLWPRLIRAAVDYVEIEQSATRKRAEDYATFFLSVLRRAPLREAGWPLAPFMDTLFPYLLGWLRSGTPVEKSALASFDFVMKEPKYCNSLKRQCACTLGDVLTRMIMDRAGDLTHDSIAHARVFANLVANYRRDLRVKQSSVDWIKSVCICCGYWMKRQRPDEQRDMKVFVDVAEEMLGTLNALLFKYGVNCAVHLDFIPPDEDECVGEMALSFTLQNYRHAHGVSKSMAFLEAIRLQLHLARARNPTPVPWAIHYSEPIAERLDKIFELIWGEARTCARRVEEAARSMARKGHEWWIEPDYRDRLVWTLAAEVICSYQYQLNQSSGQAGRRASGSDDDESRASSSTHSQSMKRIKATGPIEQLCDGLSISHLLSVPSTSSSSTAPSQKALSQMMVASQMLTQTGSSLPGSDRRVNLSSILASLQVWTALLENFPKDGESWLLGSGQAGEGLNALAKLLALLETLLLSRSESIVLMWTASALTALARLDIYHREGGDASAEAGAAGRDTEEEAPLSNALTEAWRSLLKTLLRPDLKCWAATAKLQKSGLAEGHKSGLGEHVLRLLVAILGSHVVPQADLINLQGHLWALPAFHNSAHDSRWPILLARSVLRRSELVEGQDTIGSSEVATDTDADGTSMDVDDDGEPGSSAATPSQPAAPPPATTRAERLLDYLLRWGRHQAQQVRGDIPGRSKSVSLALSTALELCHCRTDLAEAESTDFSTLGRLWMLTSPWQCLAEGRLEAHQAYVDLRERLSRRAERHDWRKDQVVRGSDALRPALDWREVGGRTVIATGRDRPLREARAREGEGGALLPRLLAHLGGWGRPEETRRRDEEDEDVASTLLWIKAAMLLRLATESEEADLALHAALSRAQSCSWKSVKNPGATVLVSAQELLADLPLFVGQAKAIDHAGWLVHTEGGGRGVQALPLPKLVKEALAFVRRRVDEAVQQVVPATGLDGRAEEASAEEEEEEEEEEAEAVGDDPEGDDLMRDDDEDEMDESPRPAKSKSKRPLEIRGTQPPAPPRRPKLAERIGQSGHSLQDLITWSRLGLLVNPGLRLARDFIGLALGLLVDDAEADVDPSAVIMDVQFRSMDPSDYLACIVTLEKFVTFGRRGQGDREPPVATLSEEVRYSVVLRVIAQLASGPPWLSGALSVHAERLRNVYRLLKKEDLSWYNSMLDLQARRAVLDDDELYGGDEQGKIFLACMVGAASHHDSDVRHAAVLGLMSAFRRFPNGPGLWDVFRRKRVLGEPRDEDLDEEAPPDVMACTSKIMASIAAGITRNKTAHETDRVTRSALSALCLWWGRWASSPAISGTAEAGMRHMAAALGYPTVAALLRYHLPYLLHDWLVEQRAGDLGLFPFTLAGWTDFSSFVRDSMHLLVPIACLSQTDSAPIPYRFDLLARFAEEVGLGQERSSVGKEGLVSLALSEYVIEIKAYELLLSIQRSEAATKARNEYVDFLPRSCPVFTEAGMAAGRILPHMQDLVLSVLDGLTAEPFGHLEDIAGGGRRVPPVGAALDALATEVLGSQPADLWAHCNPVEILLHLKVQLAQAVSPARATRLFVITREVLTRLDSFARGEATLGLALHLLLWMLEHHASLRHDCLAVLEGFLIMCVDRNKGGTTRSAEIVGRHHLSAIVGSLYTLLTKGEDEMVATAAVALIKRLVCEEAALQPYRSSLDPLPDLEGDGGAVWREQLQEVRAAIGGGEELQHPLAYAKHLAATVERSAGLGKAGQVTRLVALQALQVRLARSPPNDTAALRILVPSLLSISRDHKANPTSVRLEASRALGAIGALPPCDLLEWEPPARPLPTKSASTSPCYDAMTGALARLVDLLTDADAETVRLVLRTLHTVLLVPETEQDKDQQKTAGGGAVIRPEMSDLFNALPSSRSSTDEVGLRSEHREILRSFSHSTVRPTRHAATSDTDNPRLRTIWSDDFWDPPGLAFDRWMTRLASTLIRHGIPRQPQETAEWRLAEEMRTLLRFLASCQHVCLAHAALAEALLPLIVLGIIKGHPPTSDVLDRLTRSLNRALRKAEPRRLQALIRTLNFLREQGIYEALKALALAPASSSSRTSKRASSAAPSAPAFPGVPSLLGYLVDLNKIVVAKAALRCGALSTALLFLELGREEETKEEDTDEAALLLDQVGEVPSLLLSVLSRMAEMDGVHGVRPSNGLEFRARAGAARERADWRQALASFDSLMMQQGGGLSDGVAMALQRLDMQHILGGYLAGLQARADGSHSAALRELEYERRWRACRWEPVGVGLTGPDPFVLQYEPQAGPQSAAANLGQPSPTSALLDDLSAGTDHYHEHIHACLRALSGRDGQALARHLRNARLKTMACLAHEVPFEASRRLPQLLARLQGLYEIEEAGKVALDTVGPASLLTPGLGGSDAPARSVIEQWQQRSCRLSDDFELCEPLLALREVAIRALCPPLDAIKELVAHGCAVSEAARRGGNITVAASAMSRLDRIVSTGQGEAALMDRCKWKVQQSRVLWTSGERDLAIRTVATVGRVLHQRELVQRTADPQSRELMVEALQLAGQWMAEAGTEGTTRILDEYLKLSVEKAVPRTPLKKSARLALATYLTNLYHRRSERTRSSEWAREREVFASRQRELEVTRAQLEGMGAQDPRKREVMRRMVTLDKELKLDEEEHTAYLKSIDSFLLQALDNFKEALADGPANEPDLGAVFQVTALWFDRSNMGKAEVNTTMAQLASSVPTFKFVPLIYQVLSMLGSEHEDFQRALEGLVRRVCSEHPHHTLLQLFGLYHGKRVGEQDKEAYEQIPRLDDKVKAADRILQRLRASSETMAGLLGNLQRLLDGYIALSHTSTQALVRAQRTKNVEFSSIPSAPSIVKSFQNILGRSGRGATQPPSTLPSVLSRWPELDPTAAYRHVIRVNGFEPRFNLADSGLSRPMIIACLGSDGRKYRQVLKADDVRPDAVMMQVFDTMNTLLLQEPESRRRKLRIRTYRIVSLTPNSGAMEFVENTKTLGSILVGDKGLHERYNTGGGELRNPECRERLKAAKDMNERRKAYMDITTRFHPAFRFFFLETYPDPALWYRRRLHYTRSVSVSSIVGYLLGIGDRHASNILIDQSTAGIVHIDFGYTFEQGKVLPQPETVPFRLTRDLVDAMGVTGTDGVFRQCCDVTMQVMRQHSSVLLTILDVIARDPLHKWQAAAVQREGGGGEEEGEGEDSRHRRRIKVRKAGGASADAERVLLRVRQKLKGNEDPNGEAMSVQGHVKYLINQATDPDNLAVIYHGWSPWL